MKPGTRANHSGSSPLTRGKPTPPGAFLCLCRLIPAHAGKTRDSSLGMRRCRAHPRSRGENRPPRGGQKTRRGSSPLTRGKPPPCRFAFDRGRLIPAHAGKTLLYHTFPGLSKAHPRSRGENKEGTVIKNRELGSSPLTRGKQTSLRGDKTGLRLIPAHAGKTRRPRSSRAGGPAHPRSRGENSGMASRPRSTTGSSPLTRGKHVADLTRAAHGRLIPAHAGKTALTRRWASCGRAHPRSRGENRLPP